MSHQLNLFFVSSGIGRSWISSLVAKDFYMQEKLKQRLSYSTKYFWQEAQKTFPEATLTERKVGKFTFQL